MEQLREDRNDNYSTVLIAKLTVRSYKLNMKLKFYDCKTLWDFLIYRTFEKVPFTEVL